MIVIMIDVALWTPLAGMLMLHLFQLHVPCLHTLFYHMFGPIIKNKSEIYTAGRWEDGRWHHHHHRGSLCALDISNVHFWSSNREHASFPYLK